MTIQPKDLTTALVNNGDMITIYAIRLSFLLLIYLVVKKAIKYPANKVMNVANKEIFIERNVIDK
jgi:hypothetical protein